MRIDRMVMLKGIDRGSTISVNLREEVPIVRLVLQQEDTAYTEGNLPHITSMIVNLPWEEVENLRVGQQVKITIETLDIKEEKRYNKGYALVQEITGEA